MTCAPSNPPLNPVPAMTRVLLACLPGLLALLWLYGWGILLQLLLASTTAYLCDWATRKLRRQPLPDPASSLFGRPALADGSTLVSAVLLSAALPAYAPWWLTMSAAGFAILLGRSLYGGTGRNLFNPAMLGYAFALVAFPSHMTQWPIPHERIGLSSALQQVFGYGPGLLDGWSQATVLDSLRHNDRLTSAELFAQNPAFGTIAGLGAEWVNLAFLAGGLYLLKQRVISWQAPVGMLGALFVLSLLCWNGTGSDSNGSPAFHLFSGATMLGAFFIATEPVSGPKSNRSRLYFGIGVGTLLYLIRTWGSYPDGLAFAILLMNLCVPRLERLSSWQALRTSK